MSKAGACQASRRSQTVEKSNGLPNMRWHQSYVSMHGRMNARLVARSAVCLLEADAGIRPRITHMIDGVSSAVPVK